MISIMCHKTEIKKRVLSVCVLLLIWQIAAIHTNNTILLPSVQDVWQALLENGKEDGFLTTIFFSLMRIGKGFFCASILGFLLAAVAYFLRIKFLFAPLVSVIKAIPVASFVVLLLIWYGSEQLTVWISFLVVFPGVYENVLAGFESTDKEMLELAQVYQIRYYRKWFYIYRPAVLPYLMTAYKTLVGMAWKSGVAAELIGTPDFSIGEQLYQSKIMLETASVFAWTLVMILISSCCEYILLWLLKKWKMMQNEAKPVRMMQTYRYHKKTEKRFQKTDVVIEKFTKSYGEQKIFVETNLHFEYGKNYCIMGESGIGKTTLLRIMAGLEKMDKGSFAYKGKIVLVFQENRLLEEAGVLQNIEVLSGNKIEITKIESLLSKEVLEKPVKELSGGMKRRVCVMAAMNSDADIILMDEPFNGLDSETKRKTVEYIKSHLKGRMLIFTTHNIEDSEMMEAKVKQCNRSAMV